VGTGYVSVADSFLLEDEESDDGAADDDVDLPVGSTGMNPATAMQHRSIESLRQPLEATQWLIRHAWPVAVAHPVAGRFYTSRTPHPICPVQQRENHPGCVLPSYF
jgi:hypothetical protein